MRPTSHCTPGEDFCFDIDLLTDLASGDTFSSTGTLSNAADGFETLSITYPDDTHSITDNGDAFTTFAAGHAVTQVQAACNTTSLLKIIPSWQQYLLAVALLLLLGPLLYTFAPTRARLTAVADRVKAPFSAIWSRLPMPVRAFASRLCDWYCEYYVEIAASPIAASIIAFSNLEKDHLLDCTEYTHLVLAIILALLFYPKRQPQALPDKDDGNDRVHPAGAAGGPMPSPNAPAELPAGSNPPPLSTVPQLPHPDHSDCHQDDPRAFRDDGDDEQWFDALEQQPTTGSKGVQTENDVPRTVSTAVQTEEELTASKMVRTDEDHLLSKGVQTDAVSVYTKEEQDASYQQEKAQQEEMKRLRDTVNATKKELNDAKMIIEQRDQHILELKGALNDVKKDRDSYKSRYEASNKSKHHILKTYSELVELRQQDEAGVKELTAQVKTCQADTDAANQAARLFEQENARQKSKIESMETSEAENNAQIQSLEKQNRTSQMEATSAQQRLKFFRTRYEEKNRAVRRYQQQLKDDSVAPDMTEAELSAKIKRQGEEYQALVRQYNDFYADAKRFVDGLQKQQDDAVQAAKEESEETEKNLRSKLESSEKDKKAADTATKAAQDDASTLRGEKAELSSQLAAANSTNQDLAKEIEELREKMAAQPTPPVADDMTAPRAHLAITDSGDASTPAFEHPGDPSPSENMQNEGARWYPSIAPTIAAPGSSAPVLARATSGDASTPVDSLLAALTAAENVNSRPAGSTTAFGSGPFTFRPFAPVLDRPAGHDATASAGDGGDSMDVVETPPPGPTAKALPPRLFDWLQAGNTPLFHQIGFGGGAGGIAPVSGMTGVENTPPTQTRPTPEMVIDPQLLEEPNGSGTATGAATPDVEMGEPAKVPPAPPAANPPAGSDRPLPSQQNPGLASPGTASLLVTQLAKSEKFLSDAQTLRAKATDESEIKKRDDEIKVRTAQIENLRRVLSSQHTGSGTHRGGSGSSSQPPRENEQSDSSGDDEDTINRRRRLVPRGFKPRPK